MMMKGKQILILKKVNMNSTAVNQANSNGRMTVNDILQHDKTFRYQLLGRLQSDCKYYLGYGNRHPNRLWAGNEKEQIEFMINLHNSFEEDEKPQWLTMDEIMAFCKEMIPQK